MCWLVYSAIEEGGSSPLICLLYWLDDHILSECAYYVEYSSDMSRRTVEKKFENSVAVKTTCTM